MDYSAKALAKARLDLLEDEGEIGLVRQIAQFPRLIESSAAMHEPHRLAFYLHELASSLHSHWNKGKDQPQLRFVNDKSRELSLARVALVTSVTNTLATGLKILGVQSIILFNASSY